MRRGVWAIVLSLLVHLVPAIVLSSLSLLEKLLPPPPVTWEIVPAKRVTPPPLVSPAPEPAPPPKPTPAEPASPPERPRNTEKGGRIGKPALPKSPPLRSLHGIGADSIEQDLGLRLVLRMGEVARSPHRQAVVGLLGAFPDSRLLVAGSSVPSGEALAEALVNSAEILVIATTDPSGQRRSQTALVAVGRKLRALYDQITARRVPTWDDRELLFDNPDLLAFLPRPVESAMPPAGTDSLPPDAGSPPPAPPSLTAQLPLLRRSLPQTGPPLVAEIFNVQQRLRLRGGLPTPRLVQLSLSADTDPQVHGRLVLGSAAEAGQLRDAILAIGDKLRGDWRFKLMGISTIVDHLLFDIKDSDLLVTGFVSGATLRSLLGLATGALQIIPSGAPPPPPDLLTPPSDGGVDAH
jgi:hypothetical protein